MALNALYIYSSFDYGIKWQGSFHAYEVIILNILIL